MSSKAFIWRTGVAITAVLFLAGHVWLGVEALQWLGLVFYFICFAMYVKALYLALFRMKKVTADLLVVTVMVVSLLAGQPLSGALVAWFISMGLAISFTIIERTRRKIEALTKERRRIVRVMRDEKILELPVEQVCAGDTVIVPQGEMIPVDGEVTEGSSSVDESVITGEPFPVSKKVGDEVTSGSISLTSKLSIRAAKPGDKGFLQLMVKEIEAQLQVKPKMHQTADKIVQFFISGVVLYAIGVFLFTGGLGGDAAAGLMRMAAVTAVACPCAWALSVPTAFAASVGGLSTRGILVSGGTPLELVGRASLMALDKTGTVTMAEPRVDGIYTVGMPEDELLQLAASVESCFNHPIANAIVAHAAAKGVRFLEAEGASEYLPGLGVKADIEGRLVLLGSTETMKALDMDLPLGAGVEGLATWVAVDGEVVGAVVVQDTLREYAKGLGHSLHGLGIKKVVLATGDNEEAEAQRVAELINADQYLWGLKPADKLSLVKELKKDGFVVMVGDGVNDALALAAADVGISMGHTKADLAIKSSDIIILRNDAASLLSVVRMGKKLIQVIKQNYVWAIAFNLAGITLATMGILTPWLAALVHHLSSVLVVLNSARLTRDA